MKCSTLRDPQGRLPFDEKQLTAPTPCPDYTVRELAHLVGLTVAMREQALKKAESPANTSRVETAQRVFLDAGNLDLEPPLKWKVYGGSYRIDES